MDEYMKTYLSPRQKVIDEMTVDEQMEEFTKRIKTMIEKGNIKKEHLSIGLKKDFDYISKVEAQESELTLREFLMLLKFCNSSVHSFFYDDIIPSNLLIFD